MERQAPWLDDEDSWRISEEVASALRPGWWCHTREQMSFVEIKCVTQIPTSQGKTVFVDLTDGRTLALDETTTVFVRKQS
jgi:hypothetical protein